MAAHIAGAWAPYRLRFLFEARTSRASMLYKDTYFVRLTDADTGAEGWGEAALFRGLGDDDRPDYEQVLARYCAHPGEIDACPYSSVRFGVETALLRLREGLTPWQRGIAINGLIWMGDRATMQSRIDAKLAEGFGLLKLKIGGIDFADELDLLRLIRRRYPADRLEIRLDANGAFDAATALPRLEALSRFAIHSIEQPVRAGQPELMRRICSDSPIAVALDEELIGCTPRALKAETLAFIRPAYIILKPALCGGLSGASEWASEAEKAGIAYWYTSALESNIGLDAIAREVLARGLTMPQGLGTGELYSNNVASPLARTGAVLGYRSDLTWQLPPLQWTETAS